MLISCGPTAGEEKDATVTNALPAVEDQQAATGGGSNNDPTNTEASILGLLPTESAFGTESTARVMTPIVPDGVVDLSELEDETAVSDGTKELDEQPMPGVPDATERLIELAIQDLASRLGSNSQEIQIVDIEAVEWTSSGLGCPAPGANYLTVMVTGYRITLMAGGDHYIYHTDSREQVVLCDDGLRVSP